MKKSDFQKSVDPAPETRHLKQQISTLSKQLDSQKEQYGALHNALADILEAVPQATPPKMEYRKPRKGKAIVDKPVIHTIQLTDWHIGQVTKPEFVENFGENSWAVHQARVETLQQKLIDKTTVMRRGYQVDDAVIIHTGDYVSGDIHQELQTTNEFPAPVQAVNAGFLLGQFILNMAPHFRNVRVHLLTTDNHGRITKKPQCEDGGLNNWGFVVANIAKQFVSRLKNVQIFIHSGTTQVIEIGCERYLTSHGDGILGTFGIPFYGIERKKQREAMARMNMEKEFRFTRILIGHFHTALNHEHWMIGGSLTGTSAYDHKEGRHSRPHQTSWFVHPDHGEFDWTRWWL